MEPAIHVSIARAKAETIDSATDAVPVFERPAAKVRFRSTCTLSLRLRARLLQRLPPRLLVEIVKASGRFWLVIVADKTVTVAKPEVMARMVSSPKKAAATRKKRKKDEGPKD